MYSTPQERAGLTNRARNAFRHTYGERSYNVVSLLAQGWSYEEISDLLNESAASIAAFKANLTRGTYRDIWHNDGTNYDIEDCNW